MTDTPTDITFSVRAEHNNEDRAARFWVDHPDWDGNRGFSFMLEGRADENDRAQIKLVLRTPAIHIAPRKEDRGKPRHLLLFKGTKVVNEFKVLELIEDLANRTAGVLEASGGDWHKADNMLGRELSKIDDARVA